MKSAVSMEYCGCLLITRKCIFQRESLLILLLLKNRGHLTEAKIAELMSKIKNNSFHTAYITYQITTKQIDFSEFLLYSICSGCAAESRDARNPGSPCVGSLFHITKYLKESSYAETVFYLRATIK